MSNVKKYMDQLSKLDGALNEYDNPFNNVLDTASPSVNFIFGKSHGFPAGYSVVIYGPPRQGKTVLSNLFIGQMHQTDPDAIAVKFDTEMRTKAQLSKSNANIYGVDFDRLKAVLTNKPASIFDAIETDIAAMCEDGAKIKLIVIDSLSNIQGRREADATTIDKQIIGDSALTLGVGFKRILPTIRKHNIGLILIDQIRTEFDEKERQRHNFIKPRSPLAVLHFAEYFIAVESNKSAEGRKDLSGKELVNENMVDMVNHGESTAIKIRAKMKESFIGPRGRTAEFTFDYNKGVINTHEEVFKLGVGYNVIQKPNQVTYKFGDKTWKGKDAMLTALKESPDLQKSVIKELKCMDQEDKFAQADEAASVLVDQDDESVDLLK